jgi:hypothetical protein
LSATLIDYPVYNYVGHCGAATLIELPTVVSASASATPLVETPSALKILRRSRLRDVRASGCELANGRGMRFGRATGMGSAMGSDWVPCFDLVVGDRNWVGFDVCCG